MDDIKNMENKKEGDCWKLEDNRTVCYFGTTNVAPNELSEVNGLSATDKEPENKILAEDGSYVNADFYKDDVSVVPGETIFLN